MVERKKTGRAKARKGVSSCFRRDEAEANLAVHLGQALIDYRDTYHALILTTC